VNNKNVKKPTQQMIEWLKRTASPNRAEALEAMHALAVNLQVPLRSAILTGNILDGIYTPEVLDPSATAIFPLDFFQIADNQKQFTAFQIPSEGAIPHKVVTGNELTVQTFDVGNAISWLLKYAQQARWNIVSRAMQVFEAGFVQKNNTDGWRTIITAGAGRTDFNGGAPMVIDSAASVGQFTKRLVSLMKTTMTRLAGGNSGSVNRGRLTDLYVSPEALEDIRDWDRTQVDDLTRREIFLGEKNTDPSQLPLADIFGVRLHPIEELGVNQEFQKFFDTLGLSMGPSDEEIVVGLDLSTQDSFVNPIKQELTIFEDPNLHRQRLAGFYGWLEHGFAVLNSARVLLGSF